MVARERAGHAAWAFWIFLHPWLSVPPCLASQPLPGHASMLRDSLPPTPAHQGHALLLAHSAMPHLASGEKREGGCCGEEEEEEGGMSTMGEKMEGDYGGDGISR